MMRIILPLVVAFVIAASGASGIVVLQAKQADARRLAALPAAGADSTAEMRARAALPVAADSAVRDSAGPAATNAVRGAAPAAAAATADAAAAPCGVPAGARRLPVGADKDPATKPVASQTTSPSRTPSKRLATNPAADTAPGARSVGASGAAPGVAPGVAPRATSAASPEAGGRPVPFPGLWVGGRLSKIFTAIPAKEAARILEQMADADVIVILGSVNDRKAAEILAILPAQRAAIISKSVLAGRPAAK